MAKKVISNSTAPANVTVALTRVKSWLSEHYPKWRPFKKGATPAQIAKAATTLGQQFPQDLVELYTWCNGTGGDGFFWTPEGGSFYLLSLSEMVESWKSNRLVQSCGDFAGKIAKPQKGVTKAWWHPGWIPFASNGGGDEWCIDFAPTDAGVSGQIIVFSADSPRRERAASSLLEWLAALTLKLEAGKLVYDPDEGGLKPK